MKNFFGLLFCGFLCVGGGVLWASDDVYDKCPAKVLDIGTVEGIFLGAECGDQCYAYLKLDNGDEFTLIYNDDEEDSQQLFSKEGRRVSISYNIWQYWLEGAGECMQNYVLVKGRLVEPSASKPESKQKAEGSQSATSGGSIADIMGSQP